MAKKNQNLPLFLGLAIILAIIFLVNKSMQDLRNSSTLREEKNILLEQNKITSANIKAELDNYWDQELLIAQQIENALNYKTADRTLRILKNIEDNLRFNHNKAAVLFYLGDAYAQLGNKEKATECYVALRTKFNNGNIHLYIFNTPRLAINYKDYSVAVYEESLLRQAKLTSSLELLKSILGSPNLYGIFKDEKFLYADLVKRNIYRLNNNQPFLNSYEQYWRLAYAENTLYTFINNLLKNGQLTDFAVPDLLTKTTTLDKLRTVPNLSNTKFKFQTLRSGSGLYYYTFTSEDGNITIDILDDNKVTLVNDIFFVAPATENPETL